AGRARRAVQAGDRGPPRGPPRPAGGAPRRARPPVGPGVPGRPPDCRARAALSARRRGARVSAAPALVDSHCHVAEPEFDADREDVLQRAAASGVSTLVCVGATGPARTNARALALVGRRGPVEIVATVGVHPHHASTADDAAFALLERLARAPGVVAIGETGLDFHYNFSPPAAQRAAFARTVALARAVGLPLVVHVREAHVEAAELLRAEGAGAVGGVIHCFTGGLDDARRYLDLGFHISVAGIVTFKNADALRAAVRAVPRDRLLVETPAAPRERELVLDPELQEHGVARARQAEAGPGDELEAAREPAVEHGEHVVLLLARGVGAADLPDVPEEFDPGDEVPREPVVHARPVVEIERTAILADGGQLDAGLQYYG